METLVNLIRDLRSLSFEEDLKITIGALSSKSQKNFFSSIRFEMNEVLFKIIPVTIQGQNDLNSISFVKDNSYTFEIDPLKKDYIFLIECVFRHFGKDSFKFFVTNITKKGKDEQIIASWEVKGMFL